MDIMTVLPWLTAANTLLVIGGFLWSHLTSGGSKALKRVGELEEKIAEDKAEFTRSLATLGEAVNTRFHLMDGKLQTIEGELKHLPNREQAHRLELAVEKLSGRIDVLAKEIEPVSAIADRWQELILEQAKK